MDEQRTGEGGTHLELERLGLAVDMADELVADERRHLELCAPCRAEVDRLRAVARLVGELGAAYREEAPPQWPAASAVEALAREPERGLGWFQRLGLSLGIRRRGVATAVAAGVALLLAAAVIVMNLRSSTGPATRPHAVTAAADAGRAVVPPPVVAPAPPTVATGPGPGPLPVAPLPAPSAGRSSVVAVAAGRDVSYVMMNVPYAGGTAAVIWLNALPASGG